MMRLTRPTAFAASSSAAASSSLLPRFFASSVASSSRLFSKSAEPVASSACTPLAPPDYTTGIQFVAHRETFPVYRIMDDEGEVLDAAQLPEARGPRADAEDVQEHGDAERDGRRPLRRAAPGPHLVLHDGVGRGGHPRRQRLRARPRGRHLRPVPRGRRPHVARVHDCGLHEPVLQQRAGHGQGQADAGALWLAPPQLPDHLVAPRHPDPAGRRHRLRPQARRPLECVHLLFWRGRGERGRLPPGTELCRDAAVADDLLLPQQRLRDLDAGQGAVRGRRHRRAGAGLRRGDGAGGRQRRVGRVQRHQGRPQDRARGEQARAHRSHDLSSGPPLDERRLVGVQVEGGGAELGAEQQPDLEAAEVHGEAGLVEPGAGGRDQEGRPQGGPRAAQARRAEAQASRGRAVHGRVRLGAQAPAGAEGRTGGHDAQVPRPLHRCLPLGFLSSPLPLPLPLFLSLQHDA